MFEAVGVGVILILKLFPDTPAARLLHAWFVERPAAWLSSRTRAHVIFGILVVGLAFAGREFVIIAGTADMAMLMAWDLSLFVDALIITWTAATAGRIRLVGQMLHARFRGKAAPRPRARKSRTRLRKPAASNDDEPAIGTLAA